jgi:hypothetical protein
VLIDENGDTVMRIENGRCPMWRDDGLCRIQAERGHDALCVVCQQFPRLRQDYGDFLELGLEMSCPEAARMMLSPENWALISEEVPGGEAPDYDGELMALLRRSRPAALSLLAEEGVAVNVRLARLLLYAHHIQTVIDGGGEFDFNPAGAQTLMAQCAGKGDFSALKDFFLDLEILTDRWRRRLTGAEDAPRWDEKLCRFAAYQVYRYFYQAVSDWDLAARVKVTVALCCLVSRLEGDMEANIQLCAKEIENDAANVDALLDAAYGSRALTDVNLLGLLEARGVS